MADRATGNTTLRACWDFAFGANAAKFCSDRGEMREHSLSYVTEEQRRAGQNLARAAQRVKSQQALNAFSSIRLKRGAA